MLFIFLFISVLTNSCAHKNIIDSVDGKGQSLKINTIFPNEEIQSGKNENENDEEQMEKAIEMAIKKGPDAIRFLSTDLFIKANDASLRGESQLASYLYKNLLKLTPNDLYVQKKYAVELIRIGDLKKSLEFLKEVYEQDPKDESVGLVYAGVLTVVGNRKEARETYSRLIELNKENEEACVFLAKSYSLDNMYNDAFSQLRTCQKYMPKNPLFAYYAGKLRLDKGQAMLAISEFKKALRIKGSYYQAALAIGMIYEQDNKVQKAIENYKHFVDKNEGNNPVLSRLVQLMFAAEKFDEAIPYAEKLSGLEQADLDLKSRLGILYTRKGEYKKAIAVFKEILAVIPTSDQILYDLAYLYQRINDYENSIETYEKISEKSEYYFESIKNISEILHTQALIDESKAQKFMSFVNKYRVNSPDYVRLTMNILLADYYEAKESYKRAIASVEEISEVEGFTNGHKYYLAGLYEKDNEIIKSQELLKDILTDEPDNVDALNYLGYSYIESGSNLDKAFELIRKAVDLSPTDGYIRDSLGWYYYKIGDFKAALKQIIMANKYAPSDHVILKHLGMVYQKLELYDDSVKFLKEAISKCKDKKEKEKIRSFLGEVEAVRMPASGP